MIKLKFEENLREARKQYGYLQEELADKLNVSRQAVSKTKTKGITVGIGCILAGICAYCFLKPSMDNEDMLLYF